MISSLEKFLKQFEFGQHKRVGALKYTIDTKNCTCIIIRISTLFMFWSKYEQNIIAIYCYLPKCGYVTGFSVRWEFSTGHGCPCAAHRFCSMNCSTCTRKYL